MEGSANQSTSESDGFRRYPLLGPSNKPGYRLASSTDDRAQIRLQAASIKSMRRSLRIILSRLLAGSERSTGANVDIWPLYADLPVAGSTMDRGDQTGKD